MNAVKLVVPTGIVKIVTDGAPTSPRIIRIVPLGAPGPKGEDGEGADDLPDLSLIFENKLV